MSNTRKATPNQSRNPIICKYCNSDRVVKFGTFNGIQRYWCKDCKRKFVPDSLPKMKTPQNIIASALGMYYGGMPLDSIQRQLQQDYDKYLSEAGIYKWIIRFTKEAIRQARSFRPTVGSTWMADETMVDVGGHKIWFWDLIDVQSRYLLASHLSTTRNTEDAQILVEKAIRQAGKRPRTIITDKLRSYIDGIDLASGGTIQHIRSKPFTNVDSTNILERFQGTLKDRTDVIRGFGNMSTARLLTDGWLIHYNFFKEHTALGNVPPARKMGISLPFKDWGDILTNSLYPHTEVGETTETVPEGKPLTKSQRKRECVRKAVRKIRAKKKATSSETPGISTTRG